MESATEADNTKSYKRKHVEETQENDGNEIGVVTPQKKDQRDDGHYATPNKKRLDFDFWNQKAEANQTTEIEISKLTVGNWVDKVLRFRVSFKGELRESKIGKILSFHALDKTGEIAMVAFPKEAQKYSDILELNKAYTLQNFVVKLEDEKYRSSTGNMLQVMMNASSLLVKEEDDSSIPSIPFNFITIADTQQKPIKSKVDVLAIVVRDWGTETTSKGLLKRDVALTDESRQTMTMTIWGTKANIFMGENCVIAIRNAVVSNYMEKASLNSNSHTLLWIEPAIERNGLLRQWFEDQMLNQ